MESTYWSRALGSRITRRRALAASGTAGLSAALLAACGGSDSSSKQPAVPSLLSPIEDTSKQAKRGGLYKDSRTPDVFSWDPHLLATQWNTTISAIFMRMTIIKAGYLKPSAGEVEGNLGESWEFSPDRLTLTFKLRPGVKWHQIAPVNGRDVDVDDVLFSWNRFLSIGTSRSDYANSLNPNSPIQTVTSPDSKTIVMKLARPVATLPALLAYEYGGHFQIVPREADGGFDIRHQPIGSGPWTMAEHVPSSRIVLKRHAGYYDKERPYIDTIEYPIVNEYAAGMAQFRSGGLYRFAIRADDILPTKADVPQLSLYQTDVLANTGGISFGWRPTSKNVFRDERMRQAMSMSLDRDLYIEVNYNVSKFEKAGLPVETRWNSALYAHFYNGWWVDPRGKDFGPNAQYFQHNLTEAKKLMSAAGYANGIEVEATSAPDGYGAAYAKDIEVLQGMMGEAGFKFTPNVISYNTEFQPKYRDARGNYEGIAYKPILGGDTDALEHLRALFSATSSPNFTGLDAEGKGDYSGDPYLEDQFAKARQEVDTDKRRSIVQELQRYLGKKQYMVRYPGGASGLDLAWPVIKNHLTYRATQVSFRGPHFYEWLDDTQAPLKT